jgi:hypothetical protein
MFQKFVKTKQNEVTLFKALQDRIKTNVFVSNFVEEKKRKNETSFFWGKKAKKNEYNRSSTIEDLPLLDVSTPQGAGAAPGLVYTSKGCAAPGGVYTTGPALSLDWTCLHFIGLCWSWTA